MKNKYEWAILALWLIAVVATLFITGDMEHFTYLGPLYAICMVGSVLIVRKAQQKQKV